jgi:hypothetical protein
VGARGAMRTRRWGLNKHNKLKGMDRRLSGKEGAYTIAGVISV